MGILLDGPRSGSLLKGYQTVARQATAGRVSVAAGIKHEARRK
jgi:hypothetical protein